MLRHGGFDFGNDIPMGTGDPVLDGGVNTGGLEYGTGH